MRIKYYKMCIAEYIWIFLHLPFKFRAYIKLMYSLYKSKQKGNNNETTD